MYFRTISEPKEYIFYVECKFYVPLGSIIAIPAQSASASASIHFVLGKVSGLPAEAMLNRMYRGQFAKRNFFTPNYHSNEWGTICTYERQREIVTYWPHDTDLDSLDVRPTVGFASCKDIAVINLRNIYVKSFFGKAEQLCLGS